MAQVKKKLPKHVRPTAAHIDLPAIAFNLENIRKKIGENTRILAVVKANAYGHGAATVARYVEKKYADYFGVAIVEEGIALREAGVSKPVIVFTPPQPRQLESYFAYDLEPTVSSFQDAEMLDSMGRKLRKTVDVHLKLDTGMNRIGVKQKDLESLAGSVGGMRRVQLKGAFTHFATADDRDKSFTLQQFELFQNMLSLLRRNGIDPELVHCANSAAILEFPQTYCSMVRPGISMYGHYPSRTMPKSVPLKPAMSFVTTVAFVKSIDAGESVSYGRRFVASKRTRVATLPVGYADGYSRLLTGKASVLIGGRKFPVVGTICMDMMMVDVGDTDVAVGDEAVLVGRQNGQEIACWDLAERIGTIPYEILCGISARVPRLYTK